MLARHHGQVVLVWGAIPGERVTARVDQTKKSVAFASTLDVLSASPDRRPCSGDPALRRERAGPRRLRAAARSSRARSSATRSAGSDGSRSIAIPTVMASPERGYRMRARLHAVNGRLGFYREESHELCDAAATGQLAESTNAWIAAAQETLRSMPPGGVTAVEIAENVAGDERACHLDLREGADPSAYAALASGLVGLSAQPADSLEAETLAGTPQRDRRDSGRGWRCRRASSPRQERAGVFPGQPVSRGAAPAARDGARHRRASRRSVCRWRAVRVGPAGGGRRGRDAGRRRSGQRRRPSGQRRSVSSDAHGSNAAASRPFWLAADRCDRRR